MKTKVSLIGTNGIPAKYGGFETLAEFLAKHLNNEFEIIVYCSKTKKENRLATYLNSKLIYIPFKANGWQSMIYDAISIIHAFFYSDVLVILGFSGVFAFPFKIFFPKKKIVFNIGGIEWKKVRGKKFFGRFEIISKKIFERICVYFSDLIITDNKVLWDYVNEKYTICSELIEYGGDHAVHETVSEDLKRKFSFFEGKYDISISRAQEDMNIHMLIDAYKQLPNRNIVIVSNWYTSDYGIGLVNDNKGKYPNIFLQDAIYDLGILNAIRSNGQIYYHTHSLCGTAPSLTEAMSLGLPVICYDLDTNRSSTEEKSYYFKDSKSLISILNNLNESDLKSLSRNMLEIATRRYKWERITKLYNNSIKKII
ncbi:DUF1972 domain-containing protein [bacterium]|nr:DUF1972 domain-containing protein [bacterium]